MNRALEKMSRVVTVRPWITIIVLLIVTVFLAAGANLRAPPTEGASVAFLPPGHAIANATLEIDEFFGDSGEISIVTLLFRGDALTASGLTQMDHLIDEIVSEPSVSGLLVPVGAVVAPSTVIGELVQAAMVEGGGDAITQETIDFAQTIPEIQGALDAMTGTDTDGTQVAIANIRLADTGDERIRDAERRIYELAIANEGQLDVSSLSPVIVEDEYTEATETGLAPLLGLALLLIALLLLLFTRTFSDMLLTLTGLIVSIAWIVGAEGWLGPNGLSLIGPPSSLTAMIPVIVISLTVDYAIQAISHYREQRIEGLPVVQAVRTGLRHVTIPLTLAAVTTIVSFLATLFSPIGVISDFGIVAGLGVGLSLIVMLTLIPAGRTIIDRRREARGRLSEPRAISNALPGITPIAEALGRSVTRWPIPFLLVVIAITIGLGYAATGLKYEFSIKDILPRGGSVLRDMNTLESAVGGSTEIA
ncbi:MAG: MMPL family transporter, partial [Chloroflexi bacterium]|nr:MMPL family transporter [Chloroflexota bacterium]